MWQKAASTIYPSVHPVFGAAEIRGVDPNGASLIAKMQMPLGTAFLVDSDRVFLTNFHVVCEKSGNLRPNLQIVVHLETTATFMAAKVIALDKSRDLALIAAETPTNAKQVSFASDDILPMGVPVASFGYPIPLTEQLVSGEVEIQLTRRLSAGYVSGNQAQYRFVPAGPKELVYELNMLSYPGNSGGPLFDLEGNVVGINHATALFQGNVAAFAIASRNAELLAFLATQKIRVHLA